MQTLNETITLPTRDKVIINSKITIEADIADLVIQKKVVDDYLRESIGEYEQAECEGFKLSLKPQSRTTIDIEELVKDNPSIKTDKYANKSYFRVLRILKKEKQ